MENLTTKEIQDVLEYLDKLRESGDTNMFGASIYIENHFGYDGEISKKLLVHWMDTFDDRHTS